MSYLILKVVEPLLPDTIKLLPDPINMFVGLGRLKISFAKAIALVPSA